MRRAYPSNEWIFILFFSFFFLSLGYIYVYFIASKPSLVAFFLLQLLSQNSVLLPSSYGKCKNFHVHSIPFYSYGDANNKRIFHRRLFVIYIFFVLFRSYSVAFHCNRYPVYFTFWIDKCRWINTMLTFCQLHQVNAILSQIIVEMKKIKKQKRNGRGWRGRKQMENGINCNLRQGGNCFFSSAFSTFILHFSTITATSNQTNRPTTLYILAYSFISFYVLFFFFEFTWLLISYVTEQ